jgi:Fic family protein
VKELLEHIESLKKGFAKLQPLSAENQQRLDKKFRLEWNYNSNHIEGNTLTYGETELLLYQGDTKGQHEVREFDEMRGHDIALKLIQDLANDTERGLTEVFIRQVNKIILKEPFYKEAKTPDGQSTRKLIKIGEYKSLSNHVQLVTGEMFYYATPEETPAKMFDLMNWYEETLQNKDLHPIEVAAELHYKFVCIHPFDDGNGRISRLLMNYHIIKNGYPPVIIKTGDKKKYLFALHEADTGNLEAFKNYIAEQLIWSYEISIKAAKGESIDEKGDWEKKVEVLKKKTSTNININSKKYVHVLQNVIDKSFLPLIHAIVNKLTPLYELYTNQHFSLSLNNEGPKRYYVLRDLLHLNLLLREDLYNLFYSHSLNTFLKNGTNTFNSSYHIIFKFSDSGYSVSYKSVLKEDIQKQYGDFLTQEEIFNIESHIADTIYAQIEQNFKKLSS